MIERDVILMMARLAIEPALIERVKTAQKTDYVKRVIGLPGDKVRSKNGNIYVNNKKIDQNYISKTNEPRERGIGL